MAMVKSRYKNPDKFIAKLKAELSVARKQAWEETGRYLTSLPPQETTLQVWGNVFDDLKPNQTVAVFGDVREVVKGIQEGKRVSTVRFNRRSIRSYQI